MFCLLCATTSHAHAADPQFYIVDAMPVTQESVGGPKYGMIGLDFFIGANPRPAWWGRDFVVNMGDPEDFKARLTQAKAGQTSELELIYSTAYTPRWNESLGLYTVRVRAPMKSEFWPKNIALNYAGNLPVVFSDQTAIESPIISQINLPFAIAFGARPSKGYADAQLIAPSPSVWVKWVRVFRIEINKSRGLPSAQYETDIMLAGRPARKRESALDQIGQFTDANGVELPTFGGYGYPSWGLDGSYSNSAPVATPYEFVKFRFVWNQTRVDAPADQWLSQAFSYGGLRPIEIRFPIKRDSQLLEGDVPASQWIIKPFVEN